MYSKNEKTVFRVFIFVSVFGVITVLNNLILRHVADKWIAHVTIGTAVFGFIYAYVAIRMFLWWQRKNRRKRMNLFTDWFNELGNAIERWVIHVEYRNQVYTVEVRFIENLTYFWQARLWKGWEVEEKKAEIVNLTIGNWKRNEFEKAKELALVRAKAWFKKLEIL